MNSPAVQTCAECGARVTVGAEQCSLCGWPVEAPDTNIVEESPTAVYCNGCGWQNPSGARFCSQCGARLQELPRPRTPPAEVRPKEERALETAASGQQTLPRQVGIIISAGLVLVVALFMITAVSKKVDEQTPAVEEAPQSSPQPEEALPQDLSEIVAALDAEIALLDGEERVAKQREKLFLFVREGRMDLAAGEQQAIARTIGTADAWKRAGDLYYDWMTDIPDPVRKAEVASQAVTAYEQALVLDMDNLDVRTDMATAYLHTGNPMKGVSEIKRVLEADPTHLNANFNYGLMLTMINRPDKAIEQFEKVMTLSDSASAHYERASSAIQSIRQGGGS